MDAKQRAFILAIPGARTVCDYLVNAGNKRYVSKIPNRDVLLEEMKGRRHTDRCFIVGNGPSLTAHDLDRLRNEDCFAANHIYKLFDKTSWRPKYYVIQDRYTKMDCPLSSIEATYLFAGSYYLRCNKVCLSENMYPFYDKRDLVIKDGLLTFSNDISHFVSVNYTVTYSMMQIAVSLGYRELYLLGIDHTYAVETNDKGAVLKHNNVRNHAYEDVNSEVVANVVGMERAYRSAKKYADDNGVVIKNATRGGHLEVFSRINFNELCGQLGA